MIDRKQLWEHQQPATEYLNAHPNALLWAVMSAGKSKILIENVKHCAAHSSAKTLIICPAAVLGVWRREFWKHAFGEFDVLILDSKVNSEAKSKLIYEALKTQQSHRRPLVIVVNIESFWRPYIFKALSSVRFSKMVIDESHRIKSPSAECSKNAWRLGKNADSRTGLTGTFLPNTPGDAFSQYRFLDETIFGKYWTHFKLQYAVMNAFIPQKVERWINLDDMNQKINRIMYRIGKEVLVLPDRQDIVIEVDLSPVGRKAYNEMRKESIVEVKKQMQDGTADIKTAIAVNGAVRFLRLLQLAQGFVRDEAGDDIQTDTEKRKVLLDLLQDIDEPVCVFCWFISDLAIVQKCCEIIGLRYGEISGRRKDLTPHATMPEDIDVMAVQAKAGSAGIDLTRARIGIIMNSGLLSPGDYDQMCARIHRTGQTRNVVFYHLVTTKTVETKLIDDRGKKRDIVDALLSELADEADIF